MTEQKSMSENHHHSPSRRPGCRAYAPRRALLRIARLSLGVLLICGMASAASLELDRGAYRPGQTIEVSFSVAGATSSAWAGIVPAAIAHGSESENDRHDLAYQYLRGRDSGVLTFTAPEAPGRYDVRLNDSDSDGREIASAPFVVRAPGAADARVSLAKTRFIPGEPIEVSFEAPKGLERNAWIGIVPARVPHGEESTNDRHDLSFLYLEGRTAGTLEFRAPAAPGAYDFRFNDTDSGGREIASVGFEVLQHVDSRAMSELLAATGRVPLYGIRFASGQASIGSDSHAALAEVGELLSGDPSLRLRIEGHTDDRGAAAFNQGLSVQRAAAVRDYLIETFEIDSRRLLTAGYGSTRPLAPNETETGRAQNRRVELARL
jgi:hypothetical protein